MVQLYDWVKKQAIGTQISKRGTQVYILSYPKSGRTWLRLLIGKAICDRYNLPESQMIETFDLTSQAGLLRTHFSHDYSSILSGFPYHRMPTNKSEYTKTKVLFVYREIKDVLVSSYFQATKRTGKFEGPISAFIRSDKFGVKKIVTFYNSWYEQQHVPQAFLALSYEEMHEDPHKALRQSLEFMGMKDVDAGLLETAVSFAAFNNMKKLESSGFFQDDKMRPKDTDDKDSYKVRKGKVGGYTENLSPEDIEYIDSTVVEMGCPFLLKK